MKRKILIVVLCAFVIIFAFSGCKEGIDPFGKTEKPEISTTEEVITTEEATTAEESTTEKETTKPADITDIKRLVIDPEKGNKYLVVVNMYREMKEGYKPNLTEIFDTGYYMEEGVTPFYEEMYLAAKKDGIVLTPYSAYRSYDRQKNNYNNLTNTYMNRYGISREEAALKAATVILPPGTSEHNLGLAMDIINTKDSFAETKEFRWLQENAHKYGFILRYTAEKQPITGIVPEPWHWRFVGVEYAEDIKNSGLCLEEYLDSKGIEY